MKKQMGIYIEGAVFNADGTDINLAALLEKLESVGLELGASTQPIDDEGGLYTYTDDWETGEYEKDYFEKD